MALIKVGDIGRYKSCNSLEMTYVVLKIENNYVTYKYIGASASHSDLLASKIQFTVAEEQFIVSYSKDIIAYTTFTKLENIIWGIDD